MVANNSYCHANHSHKSSNNKLENGSRVSESGMDHLHKPPSESGTVLRDSEAGVDNLENPVVEWEFHKGLELIIHDLNCCPRCSEFVMHYSSAKAHLHPSHNMAYLARKKIIGRDLQDRIDGHQSQLEGLGESISHLQRLLEGVRQEMKTACVGLKGCCRALGKVHLELEEAQGRGEPVAASAISKSSRCPQSSPSPSPLSQPHKLPHHASTSSFPSGSNLHL